MEKMNEFELRIYDNPHPKSIQRNVDGLWTKRHLYCYSVYMYYYEFLVKMGYENSRGAREEFINTFVFHPECREYLLRANYDEYTHRTLYSVLFDYLNTINTNRFTNNIMNIVK
jgi:hypothetical protein